MLLQCYSFQEEGNRKPPPSVGLWISLVYGITRSSYRLDYKDHSPTRTT